MEDAIHPQAGLTLAKMAMPTGCVSKLHFHDNFSESAHVLSGHIRQRIGDQFRDMKQGETCLIPLGITHQTHNLGEQAAVLMVAYSSGHRNYVT